MTLKLIYQWFKEVDVGLSFPKSVGSLIGGSVDLVIVVQNRIIGDEEMVNYVH